MMVSQEFSNLVKSLEKHKTQSQSFFIRTTLGKDTQVTEEPLDRNPNSESEQIELKPADQRTENGGVKSGEKTFQTLARVKKLVSCHAGPSEGNASVMLHAGLHARVAAWLIQ